MNEVQTVFPQLDNSNVSIVYGSHDAGAIDDAGILLCKEPGSSHLIYTGYEEDRSIAYYVYGIASDDMLDTGYAAASAENFKYWLNTEAEPNVPLFVLCHVPIHAERGDNLGASYWNAALNYAATGSDDGTEIIRNVVFLHGHNHTNEKTEYYYEPGQSITVQGESSKSTFSSAIYYTYITAGYLKGMSTKNATLIHLDDQELSFTKYNGSNPTLLGTAQRIRELVSAGPENLSFSAGSYEYSFGDTISVMDLLEQSEEELSGVSLSVESSDESVISVEGMTLNAVGGGKSEITVTAENGRYARTEISVIRYADYIGIENDNLIIRIGKTVQAKCNLYTYDGTAVYGDPVTWHVDSMTNDCLTLDETTGEITALNEGEAAITASTLSGCSQPLTVHVTQPLQQIEFNESMITTGIEGYADIRTYLHTVPEICDYDIVSLTSEDTNVAYFEDEVLHFNNRGTTTVKLTTDNGLYAETQFHVVRYASGITRDNFDTIMLEAGRGTQLTYVLEPAGGVFDDEVTWKLDYANNDCITVSETGYVTAVCAGDASVTAMCANESSVNYYIRVYEKPEKISFRIDPNYIRVGAVDSITNYLDIDPEGAAEYPFTVTSSDENVIKVEEGGVIVCKGSGSSVLTVTAGDITVKSEFITGNYAWSIMNPDNHVSMCTDSEKQMKVYLSPTAEEADISDEKVTWSVTAGEEIVSVDQNGLVRASGTGSATVRAMITNGHYLDFYITVVEQPVSMSFKQDKYYYQKDTEFWIQELLDMDPSEAKYAVGLTAASDNTSVIEQRYNPGYMVMTGAGEATVTVTLDNGLTDSAKFIGLDGTNFADNIDKTDYSTVRIPIGGTKRLEYYLYSESGDTSDEIVTWSVESSDHNVTVNDQGVVKGISAGYATVRAQILNGNYVTYEILVYSMPSVFRFRQEPNYLPLTDTQYSILDYMQIEPYYALFGNFTIEIDDKTVIEPEENYLKALKKGTTTVTVKAENGMSASSVFNTGYYAEYISSEKYSYTLEQGKDTQLVYKLWPEGGIFSDEEVSWKIDDDKTGCITLSETGLVTAVKPGIAYVSAQILNGRSTSYQIVVPETPAYISFAADHLYLPLNSTEDIRNYMIIAPAGAASAELTVSPSDISMIKADSANITASAAGECTIEVATENDLHASVPATVGYYAQYIYQDNYSTRELKIGEGTQLSVRMSCPTGNYQDERVIWKVLNDPNHIISLSNDGYVTALDYGTATVAACIKNGRSAAFTIHVVEYPQSIAFEKNEYTVLKGGGGYADVLVAPAQAAGIDIQWKSMDETIAAVSSAGTARAYIQGIKEGETTIRAISPYNSTVYGECTVKVVAGQPLTEIETESNYTGYAGYLLIVPFTVAPDNAEAEIKAESDNGNVTVNYISEGRLFLTCNQEGSSDITLKDETTGVNTSFTVNVISGIPEVDESYTISRMVTLSSEGNAKTDPDEYVFISGRKYRFRINGTTYGLYGCSGSSQKIAAMMNDSGLFMAQEGSASGNPYTYEVMFDFAAIHFGTLNTVLPNGKSVVFRVVESENVNNNIKAAGSVSPEVFASFTEAMNDAGDNLGMNETLSVAAAEAEIPEETVLSENEKIVVQTYLDIEVSEITEQAGTASLALAIEPMYKVSAVNQKTDVPREIKAAEKMEISQPVTITIPLGNIFEGKTIQTVLIRHIKEDGTVYIYKGTYQNNAVTFINPNGFSDFEITLTADTYSTPEYEWNETEDGYTVTAVTIGSPSGQEITETAAAVSEIISPATCTENGVTEYTASFRNQMFSTQTKEVTVEATGHSFELKEWIWNEDYTEASAVFECTVCHETVSIPAEITEKDNVLTATVTFEDKIYTNTIDQSGPGPEIPQIIISPDQLTMPSGTSKQLTAVVISCEGEITWTSSNEAVATVDSNGLVTAHQAGTATIKAQSAENADVYDECVITVREITTLTGASLSLNGYIGVNFYFEIPEKELNDIVIVLKLGTAEKRINAIDAGIPKDTESGNRKIQCVLHAKQLRDKITLHLEDKTGNTKELYSASGTDYTEGFSYAAVDYINTVSKMESTGTQLKELLNALDVYGQWAQKRAGYNAEQVDPKEITDVSLTENLGTYQPKTSGELNEVSLGASLSLNSGTNINVYAYLPEGADVTDYKFSIDGKEVTPVYNSAEKAYIFRVINIHAKNLGTAHTFSVEKNGAVRSIKYSALSYAYTVVDLYSGNEEYFNLVNTVKALYHYYTSAAAYFKE